ncbi:RHS repeat-associated core domain-containing protein [Bosea sp. LjRoot9]|uniref:RHS repeat-associated core domain-containing protein n=1 Tax=Bosea sp. LjRoot9 TaxID=3342341 RepID=UPI003ECF0F23
MSTPIPVAPTASSVAFGYSYNQANQRIGQTTNDASWWLSPAAASTTAYTANNLDQYTAVGAATPSYDGNGNLTADGSFTYAYDPENRLTGVMQGATTVASYDFDAQGRRKQKTVGSVKTVFVTDADNREVLEYDGTSGQVLRWYAYGLGSNEALNQIEVSPATRTSFIPDIQGSVQATLASVTGTLAKGGYLPFGQSAASTGSFRYTGQRIDPETGLYYYRARMYAPALGRFLQPDPIGTQGGLNLYAYVGNDPLNATDPSGAVVEFTSTSNSLLLGGAIALPSVRGGAIALPEALGIGGAATVGALMLPLALSGDTVTKADSAQYVYVTYTRANPVTQQVYSGRTSGFANPVDPLQLQALATQRAYGQPILNSEGFSLPILDQATNNYGAIRGREQQLIDYYGGAQSVGGVSRNMINGISDYNPLRPIYMYSSSQLFGSLPSNRP